MGIQTRLRGWYNHVESLSWAQKIYAGIFLTLAIVLTGLLGVYHKQLVEVIEPLKHSLNQSSWKWIYLATAVGLCSIPPLVGFATSITLTGYIFGVRFGFLVALVGSTVGAATAFTIYRWFLQDYAGKLISRNTHFRALTDALAGSPGLKLLVMIRFCPFPFSLSNAALSTIPSVSFSKFIFATVSASPRLLLHVFVGSRLASLAEEPGQDSGSFWANIVGIVGGIVLGIVTGLLIYRRTKAIAATYEDVNGRSESGARHGDDVDDNDSFDEPLLGRS